jgi:hypothetical protein
MNAISSRFFGSFRGSAAFLLCEDVKAAEEEEGGCGALNREVLLAWLEAEKDF